MNPVEIMTSESQERMLAIVTADNLDAVLALCARWEIRATVIGRVTDTARFRVYDGLFDAVGVPGGNPEPAHGDPRTEISSDRVPIADVPIESLGDGPVYRRPVAPRRPRRTSRRRPRAGARRAFPARDRSLG